MSIKIDIHILQNLQASNINAGEDGKNKTIDNFGGFPRIRVSSQSWKYAMRKMFTFETGKRTRLLPREIIKILEDNGKKKEDVLEIVKNVIAIIFLEKKERKKSKIENLFDKKNELMLSTVIFINQDLPEKIADIVLNNFVVFVSGKSEEQEKILEPVFNELKESVNADIALFGRMLASRPELDMEGAVSMAHAFSVNALDPEPDYFIASDDFSSSIEKGAAHLGKGDTAQYFSAPCLYRVCSVNYSLLLSNLSNKKELADNALKDVINAFIMAIPKGKKNSLFAFNPPDFILISVTEGMPISLGNAFERPITVSSFKNESILDQAIERIDSYLSDLGIFYALSDKLYFAVIGDRNTPYLNEKGSKCKNMIDLLENIAIAVDEMI